MKPNERCMQDCATPSRVELEQILSITTIEIRFILDLSYPHPCHVKRWAPVSPQFSGTQPPNFYSTARWKPPPSRAHPRNPTATFQTSGSFDHTRIERAAASIQTISLNDSEHMLPNHHISVAALRLLFTCPPECCSACHRY